MKRLLIFISMLVLVVGLSTGISFGADDKRFIFSDLTAQDKKTGLMWTRDANIAGEAMTWYNAFKFIEKLNKQKYAGYSDWRLPTIKELETLTNYAKSQGDGVYYELFNRIGFRNVQPGYWSSTSSVTHTAYGWLVNMLGNSVPNGHKTSIYIYVWPVRAGQ